jgi:glycosyltransferase involved in cell wall biosynthesis
MKLVFVTQKVDVDDPLLGATVAQLRALAERFDEVHVLALSVADHDLPANVTFAQFGAPTRLRRGLHYARVLLPALSRRPDALLAHMCPIYLVLAAPLGKLLRVPLLLWYTHWAASRTLRTATRLCDAALSVDRRSFPLPSPKVRAIGHGIDTTLFRPGDAQRRSDGSLRLVALGRTSPTKGISTVVEGIELFLSRGGDGKLELRGGSTTEPERAFRAALADRIERPPLRGRVALEPPISRPSVPALLREVDALVNAHMGTLDKVVYEAAACAVPVLVSEPGFDALVDGLPLALRFRDADGLATALAAFAASDPAARAATGRELRRRVEASHSVENWADGVLRVVRELRGQGPPIHS